MQGAVVLIEDDHEITEKEDKETQHFRQRSTERRPYFKDKKIGGGQGVVYRVAA